MYRQPTIFSEVSSDFASRFWDLLQIGCKIGTDTPEILPNDAWLELEKASKEFPEVILELIQALFVLLYNEENEETCEVLATKALSISPDAPFACRYLAGVYLSKALYPQAISMLKGQADDPRGETLAIRGRAAWLSEDKELAKASFYALAATPEGRSLDHLKAAIEFLREEKDRNGLRMLLESVSDEATNDPEFCLWMGEWLISEEDETRAQEWFDRGMAACHGRHALYWNLWRTGFQVQHAEDYARYREICVGLHDRSYAESIKDLEELCKAHPEFWEARYFLGSTLRKAGECDRAIEMLQSTTDLFDFPSAWLELGALLGEMGRYEESLSASFKADELFEGRNAIAMSNLISALITLARKPEARELLARLRSAHPEHASIDAFDSLLKEGKTSRRSGFTGVRGFSPRRGR